MSKYFEAARRNAVEKAAVLDGAPRWQIAALGSTVALGGSTAILLLPAEEEVARTLSADPGIQRLCERTAPLAVLERQVRLLITGCRHGDGASSIASALAIDFSQRLSLGTMLVDAHLHQLSLHPSLSVPNRDSAELVMGRHVQLRPTGWPRLDLATCWSSGGDADGRRLLEEFEVVAAGYPVVVVDLGVTRLDVRMLPMARPRDPILMVVRYGHTERQELAAASCALRAANRSVAGVIFNARRFTNSKSER